MEYPEFLLQKLPVTTQTKKYFVYFLVDPRNGKPFYAGKGCDNRPYVHLKEINDKTDNLKKYNKIQKIRSIGLEPQIHYIKQNLDEETAYIIEEKLIAFWGREGIDHNGILTNRLPDGRPPKPNLQGFIDRYGEQQGTIKYQEFCRKITKSGESNPFYGKKHTDDTKKKMRKQKDVKICPHCGKSGRGGTMFRRHFANCEKNPKFIPLPDVTCPHCLRLFNARDTNAKRYHFDNCKKREDN